MRSPSPTDPTLETRPVPRKHRFPIRSFGPGAATNIQKTVTPPEELHRTAGSDLASQTNEAKWDYDLLRSITQWEGTDWRNDGDKVGMLANLEFTDDDKRQETSAHEKCKLPVVDIFWKRPEMTRSSYRGVRELETPVLAHS